MSYSHYLVRLYSHSMLLLSYKDIKQTLRRRTKHNIYFFGDFFQTEKHASQVWSPYTEGKIMATERVQRRATKFILKCDFLITYPERLAKLGLLPLEFRREVLDLCL